MKRTTKWLLFMLVFLLAAGTVWKVLPVTRETAYHLYRSYGKSRVISGLEGYQSIESNRFRIYYTPGDADVAPLILETAEEIYEPVVQKVGFRPPGAAVIILYPDRTEFRNAFGWGAEESALGVYHAGTIRLLSPHAWITDRTLEEKSKAFKKLGPSSHEFTHYVLDYMTNGNYPRWFTEGLAQRVEYQITGFLWLEQKSTLRQQLYTLRELETNFDKLPNQALAYRQSYLLVDYMAQQYGEESLRHLTERLAAGDQFNRAVLQATGQPMQSINVSWTRWVERNLDRLDPVP